mmetsp:Transcript_16049/g.23235  ORF Transcript_16049/g.23235 Transcript_16049/m.23235 type:complete len:80 (+) Transcript_16049:496-735(+)
MDSASLTYDELNSLPVFRKTSEENAFMCAICINKIESQELFRILPNCNHKFHKHCIDQWLMIAPKCPECRSNLRLLLNN